MSQLFRLFERLGCQPQCSPYEKKKTNFNTYSLGHLSVTHLNRGCLSGGLLVRLVRALGSLDLDPGMYASLTMGFGQQQPAIQRVIAAHL